MSVIQDGTGTGIALRINGNHRALGSAVTTGTLEEANALGDSYNLNTGNFSLTAQTSGIAYFLNDESFDYVVQGMVIGINTRTSVTARGNLFMIKDPTGGTLLSGSDGDMKSNANFGSSKALKTTTLWKKGADGLTVTGGTTHALFGVGDGRTPLAINVIIPRGSSVAFTLDPNGISSAVYIALIGHVKDPLEE